MLELYFAPGSSSFAPHIALNEVGAKFEMRPLSFDRKENREPAYLALNPEGKVPTLVIDGRPQLEAGMARTLKKGEVLQLLPVSGAQPRKMIAAHQEVSSSWQG